MASFDLPFGFTISRSKAEEKAETKSLEHQVSFVPPDNDDGSLTINSGAYYGTYVDMDGAVKNESELITKYRELALQPEVESAIDEICNDAIVKDEDGVIVKLDLDQLEVTEKVKQTIITEFDNILKILDFSNMGYSIFRRWYIDGRLYYHAILDDTKPQEGLKETRYIDPRRIRKVREIIKGVDPSTGLQVIKGTKEYFLYNELGAIGYTSQSMGVKISTDAIINTNSDLMDPKRIMVLSYLHKAMRNMNQLRMMEDSALINRMARAPERRIFYVDVANLPRIKADQYLKDVASKYRNKLVYNSDTGEIQDARKFLSMLEDFWIPSKNGVPGTKIDTLPGAQNLDDIADIELFQTKLYRSLGVPIGRLQPTDGFSLGRSTEITREELKFSKFIDRLQQRFSMLFTDLLKLQLISKNILSTTDWKEIKPYLNFTFSKDNNFEELKETELLQNRLALVQQMSLFTGVYFSNNYIKKKILRQTQEEIINMAQEMDMEAQAQQQAMDAANAQQQATEQQPQPDPSQQAPTDQSQPFPQRFVLDPAQIESHG